MGRQRAAAQSRWHMLSIATIISVAAAQPPCVNFSRMVENSGCLRLSDPDLVAVALTSMCSSRVCQQAVADIQAAFPSECLAVSITGVNVPLYGRLLQPFRAACASLANSNNAPTTTTTTPAPPQPAVPTATVRPTPTATPTPSSTSSPSSATTSAPVPGPAPSPLAKESTPLDTTMTTAPPNSAPATTATTPTTPVDGTSTPTTTTTVVDTAASLHEDPSSASHGNQSSATPSPSPSPSPSSPADKAPRLISSLAHGSSNTTTTWITVGIALAVAAMAGMTVVWWLRRRRHRRQSSTDRSSTKSESLLLSAMHHVVSATTTSTTTTKDARESLAAWRIHVRHIHEELLVGECTNATTTYALYRVRIHGDRHDQYYTSKRLAARTTASNTMTWQTQQQQQQQLCQLVAEATLVSSLQHASIIGFVGVAWQKAMDFQVLFEYMAGGDLNQYYCLDMAPHWTREKLRIALDIAEGLAYLHSFDPPRVHGELRSTHILLTHEKRAKISGFGMALAHGQGIVAASAKPWLAPELLAGSGGSCDSGMYSDKCDIYSFGVILAELDGRHCALPLASELQQPQQPYASHSDNSEKVQPVDQIVVVEPLVRVIDSCPVAIRALTLRCLAVEPHERPNALEVAFALRKILLGSDLPGDRET